MPPPPRSNNNGSSESMPPAGHTGTAGGRHGNSSTASSGGRPLPVFTVVVKVHWAAGPQGPGHSQPLTRSIANPAAAESDPHHHWKRGRCCFQDSSHTKNKNQHRPGHDRAVNSGLPETLLREAILCTGSLWGPARAETVNSPRCCTKTRPVIIAAEVWERKPKHPATIQTLCGRCWRGGGIGTNPGIGSEVSPACSRPSGVVDAPQGAPAVRALVLFSDRRQVGWNADTPPMSNNPQQNCPLGQLCRQGGIGIAILGELTASDVQLNPPVDLSLAY